jgi:polysaccharide biosynthesis protein PslH
MPANPRPSALMLAPETPYPLAGGGALRTASLLHYLAQAHDVDLIVFRQPGAPRPGKHMPAGLVRHMTVIDLPANSRTQAARALRNAVRLARRVPPLVDRFSGFGAQIAEAVKGRSYEIGVIEHFWCAPYHPQIAAACASTVLDLHNIESDLHARCAATESGPGAVAHRVFARASLRLERQWLPRFTHVLVPAEVGHALACTVSVYPNSLPSQPLPTETRRHAIVFSGNMEYHPNLSAVRFFRREIWPLLRERHPDLVWRLVGKNPDAVRAITAGDARIEVSGEVDDAVRELAKAQVAVVPLLAGSGTRLKILEAWAAGTPVVSTTIGAEGLPIRDGQHLLLADGPSQFAEAVERLLACSDLRESLAVAGRLLLEKEFTWEKARRYLVF